MKKQSALEAARSRWKIVLGMTALGAALGALPSPAKVEANSAVAAWEATNTMIATTAAQPSSPAGGSASEGIAEAQYTLFATVGEVPSRVAAKIGWTGSPAELASTVQVYFDPLTGALVFRTSQPTPELAVMIADGFAAETAAYLAERQVQWNETLLQQWAKKVDDLKAELDRKQALIGDDESDRAGIAELEAVQGQYQLAFEQKTKIGSATSSELLTPLQPAQAMPVVAGGLSAPNSRSMRGLLGALVGATLGLGSAVVLGRIDRRLRSREQAEEITGLRVRVELPFVRDEARLARVLDSLQHDPLADAYRTVRNVVGFVHGSLPVVDRARVTLVVSPGPAEGKTSLTANLAASFAEIGMNTVAVNTDFRRPKLAKRLCGTELAPLPWELEDLGWVPPGRVLRPTPIPNLSVFDLGTIGPAGELARRTAAMIPQLAREVDSIVIDSSPVSATAEVLELVPLADVIVVVIRLGETSISAAESTLAILRDLTTAPLLLVVVGGRSVNRGYDDPYQQLNGAQRQLDVAVQQSDQVAVAGGWRWGRREDYTQRVQAPPPLPIELAGLDDLLGSPTVPAEPTG
jgi:Mrp family chromosome partitioning ATPase